MNNDPITLAFAAGLMEGEGSIRINSPTKRNNGALVVAMSNTNAQIVAYMHERWPGYCKIVSHGRAAKMAATNRKPAWCWTIAAKVAARFLQSIQPYVHTERMKDRIALALEYQAQKEFTHRARSPEYRERQMDFFRRMKALNHRGIKS